MIFVDEYNNIEFDTNEANIAIYNNINNLGDEKFEIYETTTLDKCVVINDVNLSNPLILMLDRECSLEDFFKAHVGCNQESLYKNHFVKTYKDDITKYEFFIANKVFSLQFNNTATKAEDNLCLHIINSTRESLFVNILNDDKIKLCEICFDIYKYKQQLQNNSMTKEYYKIYKNFYTTISKDTSIAQSSIKNLYDFTSRILEENEYHSILLITNIKDNLISLIKIIKDYI